MPSAGEVLDLGLTFFKEGYWKMGDRRGEMGKRGFSGFVVSYGGSFRIEKRKAEKKGGG
jgi:hypothetical protein